MTTTFENATVYFKSEMFGNIQRLDVKEVTIEDGQKYAQFNDAIKVTYLQPRKRNKSGRWITSFPFLVVVRREDAITPDGLYGAPSIENGVEVRRSRYSSFDQGFITDFQAQLSAKGVTPLFQKISTERGW